MHQQRFSRRSLPLFSHPLLFEADRLVDLLQGRSGDFPVNVRDTGTTLEFHAIVPGLSKDEDAVSVRVEDQVLVIEVRAAAPAAPDDTSTWVLEEHRRRDAGERRFRLPDGLDTTQIKARLRDGVLVVSLPRATTKAPQPVVIDAE